MAPRHIPKNVIDAYELRTGFHGFGEFCEQKGKIQIDREGYECQALQK